MKNAVIALVLSFALLTSVPASAPGNGLPAGETAYSAETRNETIFAVLAADGAVRKLYAVNTVTDYGHDYVRDWGSYDAVVNLTDTSEPLLDADGVVYAYPGEFTYQGNLVSTELPWNIAITYKLGGVAVAPAELAGQSGAVACAISVTRNDAVPTVFFDNYMLQITVTLPDAVFSGAESETAAVAAIGGSRILTFTVLPGGGAELFWSADAENFRLAPVEFAALPFSMEFALPDLSSVTAGLDALTAGAADVSAGLAELSAQLAEYGGGAAAFRENAGDFKTSLDALAAQARELKRTADGLQSVYGSSPELAPLLGSVSSLCGAVDALAVAFAALDGAAQELSDGADALASAGQQAASGARSYSSVVALVPAMAQAKLDEALAAFGGSDFEPESFVDGRNAVQTVQFVMRTEEIAAKKAAVAEPEVPKRGFWRKLADLFR
ncbi:MAG: hypothetical protein LBS90_00585 [Oscillospiraceae bacterium]|jgi:hypothetical protein|nr:hypothetical protein [Oscillospiraceae bacterium]